jgi:hypothetical protein
MRSAVLSFTLLTAFAVTPAVAQQSYGTQPADTASTGGATMGEVPAPPSHQPMSHHATNLNEQTARSRISPSLPTPAVGPDADATGYLQAAQTALSQNRTGEAQAALENAETYLLNRSVPQGAVNQPDQNPAVRNITEALQALGSGNRTRSMELIQQTIPLAQQHQAMIQSASPGMPGGPQGGMQPGTTGYQANPNDYRTGMNTGGYQPGPATAGSYQPGPGTAGSYQPGMTGYQGGYQPGATGAPPPASYGAPPPR